MNTLELSCAVAIVLGTVAPCSVAQNGGLSTEEAASVWPRWQGRLSVGAEAGVARNASLLGDYYITDAFHSGGGGLRATSGLIVSQRSQAAQPMNSSLAGRGFNVERRLGAPMAAWGDAETGSSTLPYVGLGYTGVVARTGFSFSADLGIMALNAGPKVRFGNRIAGSQTSDDLMREIRLSPMLSLGVSYAF